MNGSKKWLIGVMVPVVLGLVVYIWTEAIHRAQASEAKITEIEVDLAQEKVRNGVQYREIERRLAEIEASVHRIEDQLRQRRF